MYYVVTWQGVLISKMTLECVLKFVNFFTFRDLLPQLNIIFEHSLVYKYQSFHWIVIPQLVECHYWWAVKDVNVLIRWCQCSYSMMSMFLFYDSFPYKVRYSLLRDKVHIYVGSQISPSLSVSGRAPLNFCRTILTRSLGCVLRMCRMVFSLSTAAKRQYLQRYGW